MKLSKNNIRSLYSVMTQFFRGTPQSDSLELETLLRELSNNGGLECADVLPHMKNAEYDLALEKLDCLKAIGERIRGIDCLRAVCFYKTGREFDALEAAKEELRWFPDHRQARRIADCLSVKLILPPTLGNNEFKEILNIVRPYTMLGEVRLHSLFELAWQVCVLDLPGDFVECGVAGGGASALLAAVIAKHSKRPRRLFACDTFSGMPKPTDRDFHDDCHAADSGWGTGSCSAPINSLNEVCSKLDVQNIVVPVRGLFAETLPCLRERVDSIGFLHMDGDWYESTRDTLVYLFDKLTPGSMVQVDDYGYWKGARDALHEFESERGLRFCLNTIDSTGVWFMKPWAARQRAKLLNLGCGRTYHPDWINLDAVQSDSSVLLHDLRSPLPFKQGTFDAVYHSHVLEHLSNVHALSFIKECHRVMLPGGILRVVVPDLETIARHYLRCLDGCLAGDSEAAKRYEWIILELLDQLVREKSGGKMLEYWRQNPMPAEDFVVQRMGREVLRVLESNRASGPAGNSGAPDGRGAAQPSDLTAEARFRATGEVHRWMYDRWSLRLLLEHAGFSEVKTCSASESRIDGFNRYHLDEDEHGTVRKPDSLFMEARKPA